jgi:hypothetical protein
MQIIGRSSPFSNSVISSGLDSVAVGVAQSAQTNGTAKLDSAISSFSNIDPSAVNILDFQPQVLDAAEFSDPISFLTSQGNTSDVLNAMDDSSFRPTAELSGFSNDLTDISNSFPGAQPDPLNDQIETLNNMQSTVVGLKDLQANADLQFQLANISGTPLGIPQKDDILKKRAEEKAAIVQAQSIEGKEQSAATQSEPSAFSGSIGPILNGHGDASIGDDTYVDVGGEAFVGAKGSVNGTADLGDYGSVSGGAGGYVGVGAKGDIDVGVKDGKIHFKVGGGLALGIGPEFDLGFDLNYGKIADDLYDAGSDAVDFGKQAMEDAIDAAKKGIGWVGDAASSAEQAAEDAMKEAIDAAKKALGWAGDAASDAADAAGDVVDDIGDAASDVGDAIGDGADAVGDAVSDVFDW